MKETGKNQEIDNLIAEEMRTAFGYGKDHLIEEFDEAAMQMDETDRIPPEGEFEKIAAKVHAFDEEKKKSSKKVVRLKRVGKVGLLVAILGCVVLGTGIGASGKRAYEITMRTTDKGKSNIWNNTDNLVAVYEVEEAYQEIKDKLGISVLRLIYIPEKMNLSELEMGTSYARMEFTRDDNYIYFIQAQFPVEISGSTESDRDEKKSHETIYNKYLSMDLEIKENLVSNKAVELSTEFSIDKTYYYLAGKISEEEFIQIIKKISH